MQKHLLILLIAFLILTISATVSRPSQAGDSARAPSALVLLENFDSLLSGNIHSQGAWIANEPGAAAGAIVDNTPPLYMSGQVLKNNPNGILNRGNAFLPLGPNQVDSTEVATIFFQVAVEDLSDSDFSIGLTADATPDIFNPAGLEQYLVDLRFNQNGMQVRNGSSYQSVNNFTLTNDTLYHIWLVVDNNLDTFTVFIDDQFTSSPTQLATADGALFFFRNFSADPLRAFAIQNHGLNHGDSYLDNLYIHHGGENLVQPAPAFQVVDNFDNLNDGSLDGRNGWEVDGTATVGDDPADSSNKVASIEGSDTTAYRSTSQIAPSSLGTIHFRLYRNGTINSFSGLSNVTSPSDWGDFEAQFGTQNDSTGNFVVRNGGAFTQVGNLFDEGVWYCIWLVVDNNNDSYQAFAKGGDLSLITQLGDGSFDFRNGGDNPLNRFFSKTGPGSTGRYHLDDIYIDSQRKNLTSPGHDCDDQVTVDPDQPITDPFPGAIYKDGAAVKFETIATLPASTSGTLHPRTNPRTRLTYLTHSNDGSDRLFANDLRGNMHVIDLNDGSNNVYLDLKSNVSDWVEAPGLNSGFSTFAFHPDFKNNGRFYTIHTEDAKTSNETADFETINTQTIVSHNVLTEWTANNPASNTFSGTNREVLRVEQASFLHGMQHARFNPTANVGDEDYGLLYVSLGDGEQEPYFTETAQDRRTIQGSIIRIDPAGENAGNSEYGIPLSNPYIGSSKGYLPEIFAYGFRNPHRMAWDTLTGQMFVSGIGQNNIDELNIVQKGGNYGWNEREGSFRFNENDPEPVYPLPNDDATNNYNYPVAEYDHDEGFAISGGIPYRGTLMPELYGAYIFGDIVNGRLFYVKIDELSFTEQATIHALTLLNESNNQVDFKPLVESANQRADLRFGIDEANEIYIMSRHDGKIRKLISAEKAPGLSIISGITKSSTDGAYHYDVVPADFGSSPQPFSDSSARITALPASLAGQGVELFVNRNSERTISTSEHIGLNIAKPAEIFVAIDDRNNAPNWLSSWQDTGETVILSQSGNMLKHNLFKRTVLAGELILGSNNGGGSANNYFVLAKTIEVEPPVTPIPESTETMTHTPTNTLAPTVELLITPSHTPDPQVSSTPTPTETPFDTPIPPSELKIKSYLPFASR